MDAMTPTRYVTCRFCNGRVGTSEGDLTKLEKHMINSHDMLFAKEFSIVLNIISQEEVESILKRLKLRLSTFKDTGALEYNNNIFENIVDKTGESESETDANDEQKSEDSGLNDLEKQKQAIFSLLDSDEEDEDAVFQENAKNPIERVRRRVFSEHLTPTHSTDLEDEMARTSILSDKNFNAKEEDTGEPFSQNTYFDDQRKKIENMLLSDEEDSDSENEDDPDPSTEEELVEITDDVEQTEDNSSEVNADSRAAAEELLEDSIAKVKEEIDSEVGTLRYSSLNDKEQVRKDSDNVTKVKQEQVVNQGAVKDSKESERIVEEQEQVDYEIVKTTEPLEATEPLERTEPLDTTEPFQEQSTYIEESHPENVPENEAQEATDEPDPLAIDIENPKPAKRRRTQKPVEQNVADKYKGQYDHVNLVTTFIEKHICRLCYAQPGGTAELLKKHEEEAHQDDQEALAREFFAVPDLVHRCDQCPHIPGYLTRNLLNKHMVIAHKRKMRVACKVCNVEVMEYKLEAHMKQKHSDNPEEFKCKLCYTQSSSLANLKRHIINRHREDKHHIDRDITEEDLKYTCNKCDLKFLSEHLRAFHFKKEHRARDQSRETSSVASGDPVSCKLCYEEFRTNSCLLSHKRLHNEDIESSDIELKEENLKFECMRCNKRFLSIHLQKYHAITSHSMGQKFDTDNKKYQCGLCYESYYDKRTLVKHFDHLHNDELDYLIKPIDESDLKYKCSSCDIKFVTIRSQSHHELKRHGIPESLRSLDSKTTIGESSLKSTRSQT